MARRAVVLMNLGGPDSPAAVRPFLYNLFSDPAIIDLPALLRRPLAWLIARQRSRAASEIYAHLGGGSPLLANTEAQARALEAALGPEYRCFIAMRYWHPQTEETVAAVAAWRPDEIVLLPLYPQFSTTTAGSSLTAWHAEARRQGLACPVREVPPYPTEPGFIAALAGHIDEQRAEERRPARLLLSAHGLPLKIVRKGDSYPAQIESTAAAAIDALEHRPEDWRVCYQSRVGPLAWLGPSVDEEIRRAGQDKVGIVIAPISFVSEHSETLVELDRDYRRLAESCGVPFYRRAATVGTDPRFMAGLARLVRGGDAKTAGRPREAAALP
jgi:protoporphyrin/coproporphyrin ferrochelatase